jgi:glycosyltransferase involved in cell wall biosynthesis
MKVAIINTFNAKDITKWSGIPFYLSLILDSIFEDKIHYIQLPPFKRGIRSYLLSFYFNRILKRKYYTWADKKFIKSNLSIASTRVMDYDLIITFDFYLVPLLKKEHNKVIHWNDATFENLYNFYDGYSNFSDYAFESAHLLQRQALELSDIIIYSSDWAINSAISHYKIKKEKLKKIVFPSNFKKILHDNDIKTVINSRKTNTVKLLFLTADWQRKGGYDAVSVLNKLISLGIKASLHVVGTKIPDEYKKIPNIIEYGYINKTDSDGENSLVELFKECSFLIMPTRVDTTPVAFSEANSFALPVITTSVGAIPSIIENNVNGHYFDVSNFKDEAIKYITQNLPMSQSYESLCYSSFSYYKQNMTREQVRLKLLAICDELKIPHL